MAGNFVHRGRRLTVPFTTAHTAGDLVYVGASGAAGGGFYGVVQDNVAAGATGTLILEGTWNLKRAPTTLAFGTVVAAPATETATSLPLLGYDAAAAASGVVPGPATVGWRPVGRTIATGTATTAKIQLFNPNQTY